MITSLLILLFLFILIYRPFIKSWIGFPSNSISYAVIEAYFSLILFSYFISELTSIGNWYIPNILFWGWGAYSLINLIFILKCSPNLKFNITAQPSLIEIIYFIFIIILFFTAIYCPPNSWDSMSYHLPRIEHWRSNQNIYPYDTYQGRQVFFPPLFDYVIGIFQTTTESDYLSNIPSFLALIGSICLLKIFGRKLQVNISNLYLSLGFFLSYPLIIFQSTSTLNDLGNLFMFGLFLLTFHEIYFEHKHTLSKYVFLSTTAFICVLMKYNNFFFIFPQLLIVIFQLFNVRETKLIWKLIPINLLLFAIFLGPFIARNYIAYGNFLGGTNFPILENENKSIAGFLSIASKNFLDYLITPFQTANHYLFNLLQKFHQLIAIDIHSPLTNLSDGYNINYLLSEEYSSSFPHFLIFFFLIITLFVYKNTAFKLKKIFLVYLASIVISILLNSLFFKWSVWGTRTRLQLFFEFTLLISILIQSIDVQKFKLINNSLNIFYGLSIVFFILLNPYKPFIDNLFIRQILNKPIKVLNQSHISTFKIDLNLLSTFYDKKRENSTYQLKSDLSFKEKMASINLVGRYFPLNLPIHLPEKSIFRMNREQRYFALLPSYYPRFKKIIDRIPKFTKKIKFTTIYNEWEYIFWKMAQNRISKKIELGLPGEFNKKFQHKNISNKDFEIEIISDQTSFKGIKKIK